MNHGLSQSEVINMCSQLQDHLFRMLCPTSPTAGAWAGGRAPTHLRKKAQLQSRHHTNLCPLRLSSSRGENKFMELQNCLGQKRLSRSSSSTINPALPGPLLTHDHKCHIHTLSEHHGVFSSQAGQVQWSHIKFCCQAMTLLISSQHECEEALSPLTGYLSWL